MDGAIHRAAGPELRSIVTLAVMCYRSGEDDTRISFAGKIYYPYGSPIWHGGKYNEAKLLADCYYHACNWQRKIICKALLFLQSAPEYMAILWMKRQKLLLILALSMEMLWKYTLFVLIRRP